jgi:anthranilate phosphoribosyltransferase
MAGVIAEVFARRGDSVLVMRGEDGLDEFTTTAPTRVWAVRDGAVTETVLDAADLGIARSRPQDLRGGDASYNAEVARSLFAGKTGPVRDAVLVNAAAALVAQGGWGNDLAAALCGGIDRAAAAIDSGAAADLMKRWLTMAQGS